MAWGLVGRRDVVVGTRVEVGRKVGDLVAA
jgi:hypothetical protein